MKLGPTISKDRYICSETGAHFEFIDMCKRICKIDADRMKEVQNDKKSLNKKLSNPQTVEALRNKLKQETAEKQAL